MVDEEQPSNGGDGPSQHDQLEQLAARSDLHARSLFHGYDRKGSTEEALQSLDSQNLDFLAKDKMYDILYSLQQEQDKSAQLHSSPQQEHSSPQQVHSNFASFKRCLTMLTVFTTLMALICFGTSMVAAQNSKDLTSSLGSSDFVLIDNESARMVTTPEKVVVHMNPIKEEISRRHLQAVEEAACHQEQYATDCAGSDWETTVVCEAVGTVDYDDATRLYQAFCPQYPDITDASQCANIGLSEVWLECGAGLTRILGGAYFPTAGTPGWDESETVSALLREDIFTLIPFKEHSPFVPFNTEFCFSNTSETCGTASQSLLSRSSARYATEPHFRFLNRRRTCFCSPRGVRRIDSIQALLYSNPGKRRRRNIGNLLFPSHIHN